MMMQQQLGQKAVTSSSCSLLLSPRPRGGERCGERERSLGIVVAALGATEETPKSA
jgi:hypothetical protein